MTKYIYQNAEWPKFGWNNDHVTALLSSIRYRQGRLLGGMESLGFNLRSEALLGSLTLNIVKTSEIEGELLNAAQVRSSVARRLGIDAAGLVATDRHIDGVVEMMLDATQNFQSTLTKERLFGWHASLFPTGRSGMYEINTGKWRDDHKGPMQVVSGGYGKEKVHFEAPPATAIEHEVTQFLGWFNSDTEMDPVLKASVAHLWFITIHPFDDGNGRVARAIADMQLARADSSSLRFYSMSAQIQRERNDYYDMLESTQKETLDITRWTDWFLQCLSRSLDATDVLLAAILYKANFWDRFSETLFNARQSTMINKLLDGFEGKLTSSKWAKITKCSQDTAVRDIQDLVNKNVLIKENAGGRSTAYRLSAIE